ncbi:alpha/beta fold hydrolase [Streptomyces lavendulae]|uniref:alpha/beta fold hydrolase n=1 Tax=Streptomyces lavendulae TaxID=1914 RepID=UPI0036A43610
MIDRHSVTVNGIRLSYEVSGPPDGDPLLLLPALGEGAGDWAPVREALDRERRVYAVDLRGHGHSDRPGAYSLELMRDDVIGLLAALGLDRVDLVGHSMGGVVAHLVAQARPWRVVRLVLEDAPAPLPREARAPVRPEGELPYDWEMVLAVRAQLDRPDPDWLAGLGRITAPTLVVAGGPTSHVPRENIAELVRRIPDARLRTIPVGHLVHTAAPREFASVVTEFLGELPDAETARRWLAEDGITQTGEETWYDADPPAATLTRADVAEGLGCMAFTDEALDAAGRLRVAMGLMEVLGDHILVIRQIHLAHTGPDGPLPAEALWGGYRRRLEAAPECEALLASLWYTWFEDHTTSAEAFAEVLGADRERLVPGAPEPLLRRARRVLENSGPVPWGAKAPTLRAAAGVPGLRHAVFRALLLGYHDIYGDLDPAEALVLLDRLDLPAGTPHAAPLRTVLAAGHRNRRHDPEVWRAATGNAAGTGAGTGAGATGRSSGTPPAP